jgi:hypothetical protein
MDQQRGMEINPRTDPEDAAIELRFKVVALMQDLEALKFEDLDQLKDLMRQAYALAQEAQFPKLQTHPTLERQILQREFGHCV